MQTQPAPALNKRRFWLCLVLVFFCGFLCGGVVCVIGVKYAFTHFPPPVERVSRKIAAGIAKEYSLDEATRKRVEDEVFRLGAEFTGQLGETRASIEALIERRRESIAEIMPDEERKTRWRREYRDFFPQLPAIAPRGEAGR